MNVSETLEQFSQELGFELFGVARAEPLSEELEHLKAWLAEGMHGQMDWFERNPERRCDPDKVLPGCKSVVVVGKNYLHEYNIPDEIPETGKVSRYAQGKDYHRVLDKKLKKIAKKCTAIGGDGTWSKAYVDHGPVMERQWAEKAGLGFIGRHTLLINPEKGSWFFLGVILTTLEIPPTERKITSSCGDCRRCLDACPTDAISEFPHKVDARRCISYLTIEHKGEVDPELQEKFSGWVFGCDICQDVCPYNQKRAEPQESDAFQPKMLPANWSLVEMLELDEDKLMDQFKQSPIRRAGVDSIHRNAKIAQKLEED